MTSQQLRFPTLSRCFSRLLNQTRNADIIVLYLEQDVSLSQIPDEVLALQKQGVKICITSWNLKPHTKYYYAMQEYPDSIVITVDDDVLYDHRLVETLLNAYNRYPNAVAATRVHRVRFLENGSLAPYHTWEMEYTGLHVPSLELFATGVGGVLYPPNCLHPDVFQQQNILDLCLYGDDIWLKVMQLRMNVPVIYVAMDRTHPEVIPECRESALYRKNLYEGRNDLYLNQVFSFYNIQPRQMIFCNNEQEKTAVKANGQISVECNV
jgi:predicted DNA-binding protein YlxM (UPF0122 family)